MTAQEGCFHVYNNGIEKRNIFLLPPDSVLADILLSLPLIILFELTLILNWAFERRRARK